MSFFKILNIFEVNLHNINTTMQSVKLNIKAHMLNSCAAQR